MRFWSGDLIGVGFGGLNAGIGKCRGAGGRIPCGGRGCGAGLRSGRESPPPGSFEAAGETVSLH